MDNFNYLDLFKEKNIKITKQRKAIVSILSNADTPMNAMQIFMALKAVDSTINLSTIYRTLDSLLAAEILKKITIYDNSTSFYEFFKSEHKHYFVCLSCKKTVPINHCHIKEYEKELEQDKGMQIVGHELYLYGYCKDCCINAKKAMHIK